MEHNSDNSQLKAFAEPNRIIRDFVQGIEIEIKTLSGHTNSVWSLAVLPDGSLASGSYDTKIKI